MEDFVWAGTQTPLFQRFTKWVDNGFSRLNADSTLRSRHCSWRFWTRGMDHQVVCGLIRNSSDIHGRSFPLLYIGAGELKEWVNNCSMLPFAFESIWKSFEYIASARFDTIGQLNNSLQLLHQPLPEWRKYQQRIYDAANLAKTARCEEAIAGRKRLMTIDCQQPENLPYDWQFCKSVMSQNDDQAPTAVFIGEVNQSVAVAIISNTLIPDDFVWLWKLNANDSNRSIRSAAQRG